MPCHSLFNKIFTKNILSARYCAGDMLLLLLMMMLLLMLLMMLMMLLMKKKVVMMVMLQANAHYVPGTVQSTCHVLTRFYIFRWWTWNLW